MMNTKRVVALTFVLAYLSLVCVAQTGMERVKAEALKLSSLEEQLRKLTDEIGGRVPGTPAMEQAIRWGVNGFKAAGADSIVTEQFTIPASWAEGATRVEVTSPIHFRVRAVSAPWGPSAKVNRGRVVDIGMGSREDFAKAGDITGAILLLHTKVLHSWEDLLGEYLQGPPVIEAAVRGKAAALAILGSREQDILYRHLKAIDGKIERIPTVLLAREDGQRIARLLTAGQRVEMSLSIPNAVGGPVPTSNVIAEIRGSELPNEFVILGAHLDSWDLGTGAVDNGCNAALVIDALRAIKAAGVRPRRSIRFILFSAEEQGMLGSWAYARTHRNELDNASAVIIFDDGTGRVVGFSVGGRKELVPTVTELIAPFKEWGVSDVSADAFVGTDNLDFLLEGVPTLVAEQDPANYLVNYHATSDTYDKIDFPQLKKNVTIGSMIALAIADAPSRFGSRQSRTEIEQLVRDTHLDEQLKLFRAWGDWEKSERGRQKQ